MQSPMTQNVKVSHFLKLASSQVPGCGFDVDWSAALRSRAVARSWHFKPSRFAFRVRGKHCAATRERILSPIVASAGFASMHGLSVISGHENERAGE